MNKRIAVSMLIGLAVASHAAFAQDVSSPAHPADRNAQAAQSTQRAMSSSADRAYWATHDDDAPGYPFNP